MSENANKLEQLLGFDAAKSNKLTKDVFGEVVQEIQEEKLKEAKGKAKEMFVKAMEVRRNMDKSRKQFDNEFKKNEKELGKILNMIQGLLTGETPPEEAPTAEEGAEVNIG